MEFHRYNNESKVESRLWEINALLEINGSIECSNDVDLNREFSDVGEGYRAEIPFVPSYLS